MSWLSKVIEEEANRAEFILEKDGKLVRPIDASDPDDDLGPLATLEKKATDFLDSIRESERERVVTKTLRPKDVEESKRGPLGEAEERAVKTLRDFQESERIRYQQSQIRGGDVVRPIVSRMRACVRVPCDFALTQILRLATLCQGCSGPAR